MKKLNHLVFWPPFIFLTLTLFLSIQSPEQFIGWVSGAKNWILVNFGFLFSWATFAFLLILIAVYFSPLGKIRIGGKDAKPLLTRWRWFAITLTTTIATGILFWGTAEPMYHMHSPPSGLGLQANSPEAAVFAMSTMFMHWTITPYGIYTLAGLAFALAYYNMRQPFSLGSLMYPVIGRSAHGWIGKLVDMICLYSLVAGMAASMGTGIITISGGIHRMTGLEETGFLLGMICLVIVLCFVASAASGLMKGIRVLSDWNIKAFLGLAAFTLIFGPTLSMLELGGKGLVDYVVNFLPRSVNVGTNIETEWQHSWTIFYWANWLAWAPITALFLGRLSLGYTVRDFIHYNLLLPSLFGGVWMVIFSGASLEIDGMNNGFLNEILQKSGPQNVVFELFNQLPLSTLVSGVFLLIAFLSYVTAADSNTSAMSSMSSEGITPENPESPLGIKVIWGLIIGGLSWTMISNSGIEGVKQISVLGGFPALFLIILVGVGLVRMILNPSKLNR
ncbi:MAG: BCCT family transporter [Bacteroidia bacterium]|nr:BCCT family transporter [Bacteroidia bacterium]